MRKRCFNNDNDYRFLYFNKIDKKVKRSSIENLGKTIENSRNC